MKILIAALFGIPVLALIGIYLRLLHQVCVEDKKRAKAWLQAERLSEYKDD